MLSTNLIKKPKFIAFKYDILIKNYLLIIHCFSLNYKLIIIFKSKETIL